MVTLADFPKSFCHYVTTVHAKMPVQDGAASWQLPHRTEWIGYPHRVGKENHGWQIVRQMLPRLIKRVSPLAACGQLVFQMHMTVPTRSVSVAEARQRILDELPAQTLLIAASKRQSDERIEAALKAGQRVFGENRVQEAETRWRQRSEVIDGLKLHMIGPLQTNKAEAAIRLFDVIHTLDRPKLLQALIRAVEKTGQPPPDLFIQVNTGAEPQKGGVLLPQLQSLIDLTRQNWPGRLLGLMCIPPVDQPAAPHFALLRRLADQQALAACSMGMSQDYALAGKLGATHVRIGSAFFGPRQDQGTP